MRTPSCRNPPGRGCRAGVHHLQQLPALLADGNPTLPPRVLRVAAALRPRRCVTGVEVRPALARHAARCGVIVITRTAPRASLWEVQVVALYRAAPPTGSVA